MERDRASPGRTTTSSGARPLASNSPAYKSVIVQLVPAGRGAELAAEGAGQESTGSDWSHKSDPEPEHQS